ncbi:MAG TPA: DUF4337 family protein [Lacunisphaera sp.]|nr:DUF4337 family protein [Lacunisphaera sp.]
MSTRIPDTLKADLPPSKWGKVLGATPVIMTVVATLLAGLSNGEMTKAQYARALAAQQQSKAGDQWAFFQAKRLRSAIQSGTLDVLQFTDDVRPVDGEALRAFAAELPNAAAAQHALTFLVSARLPDAAPPTPPDPAMRAVLEAIESGLPDTELIPRLNAAKPELVSFALNTARAEVLAFDERLQSVIADGDRLGAAIEASGSASLRRDFARLRLNYSTMRYDAEAGLNRAVANLLEIQVRQSNLTAERHHRRSQRFFYGLLAAQTAVIIATFAIAARQRNLLWSLAAAAGLGAITFAAYVFLYL